MASSVQVESRKLLRQLSHQSSEGSESVVSEELELLRNVYFDELDISYTESGDAVLHYHITPSTADDKDRQFVYLDLTITLNVTYPNLIPEIHFGESRGLSDAHLRGISEGLHHKSLEHLGSPMIYELVEYAKDCLTDNNRPCGQCAICQFEFKETDDFTKTQCYHYFHLPCLASYVKFYEHQQREGRQEEHQIDPMLRKKPKQLECPVCREPIATDTTCLEAIQGVVPSSAVDNSEASSPSCLSCVLQKSRESLVYSTTIFRPSKELQSWQVKMASLLRQQREKGGVTDPSGEDDVIDDSWVSMAGHRREGDARMEEQSFYQAQQQGRNKKVTQRRSENTTNHPIDIQLLDTSDTKEATLKSCQGSKNSVRERHQRTRGPNRTHANSRPRPHFIPTESCNSKPHDEDPHSRPLGEGSHSRTQGEGPHSRPLGEGSHSRTQGEGPHSRLLGEGPHSRPLGEGSHSRTQGEGPHSRPLSEGPNYTQLNKRLHYHRDHRPFNRVYKNSRSSAEMRQAGDCNGANDDGRKDQRYNPHHIQDENYHQVYSSRLKSSRDEHYHKERDSKPKHVQEVPAGVPVISSNQKMRNKEVVEHVTVTSKEETPTVEDPPKEQTCSREHGAKSRHLSSGRNAPRGRSCEARESSYHRNQQSRKRTEKRGRTEDRAPMTERSPQEP